MVSFVAYVSPFYGIFVKKIAIVLRNFANKQTTASKIITSLEEVTRKSAAV